MDELSLEQQLAKMSEDWDARARENARYYVDTSNQNWTEEEVFASGERTVAEEIRTDMINICQGLHPEQMRVLEIGCGAGRVTRGPPSSLLVRERPTRTRNGRAPVSPSW